MSFAQSIREFFDTLFPNRTVLLLRREIEENRRQSQQRESILVAVYNHEIENSKEAREAAFTEIERLLGDHAKQVEEIRRERDYFRGRAERLELRILPDRRDPREGKTPVSVVQPPRTRWQQVQAENAMKLERERQEAEKGKQTIASPSAEDLDAVAAEEQTRADTAISQ